MSETINVASLSEGAFTLVEAGPDGRLGSPDDVDVTSGIVTFREDVQGVFMTFATTLPPSRYSASLSDSISDLAGNTLEEPFTWTFTTFEIEDDSDDDCLPDDVELALGLNPANADSNADGIPDGQEDSDTDGLLNCEEILTGLNAGNADTDGDRLDDAVELAAGTNPILTDTDGDGFIDGEEIEFDSNPLDEDDLPVVIDFQLREASGLPISMLNETDPSGESLSEVAGITASVLNETDPSADPPGAASGPVVSVLNTVNPSGPGVSEAVGDIVSVENLVLP